MLSAKMHALASLVAGLMATSTLAASAQPDVSALEAIQSMKSAPNGYWHVADDGVARAYDETDTVIDYVALSNAQLQGLLSNLPAPFQEESAHLHDVFDKVNGLDVVDESILRDPPAFLRPAIDRERFNAQHTSDAATSGLTERADLYCRGQPCVSDPACQFLGCSGCGFLDQILPGGGGVCF